ncbi:hypothetical protein LSH36_816g00058 [Paralvinella palmiformis]|uniref:Kelch domain-containing protein 10 n=1 Tax=Paralvinella palmiformis TaxID=53620 RepID=A0AAD9J0M2_9ANNE|nr:hypothetical protein LSH36_816g00058 [Paralvinella palmiformis]
MSAPIRVGRFELIEPKSNRNGHPLKPVGRSGHCSVADDGNLYVFGGYNPQGPLATWDEAFEGHNVITLPISLEKQGILPELWIFNFATKRWCAPETRGVTPTAAASSSIILLKDKLLVYGGTVFPFGHLMSNSLFLLDLSKDFTWKRINGTGHGHELPLATYGQSTLVHDEHLYVFAGAFSFHLEPVNDLHRLNIKTLKWEKIAAFGNLPNGSYKQEMAIDPAGSCFYVLGGGHLAGAIGLEQFNVYHFETRTWSSKHTTADPKHGFPKSRSSFGCVQRDGWVVILGGRHYSVNVLDVLNVGLDDVWALELGSLQWTKLEIVLPKPMYFHTVSLAPSGMLYIYGGIVEHEQRSSDIYQLRLFAPTLAELAWQKLIEKTDSFNNISRADLKNVGLPSGYIDRLPP